VVVEIIFLYNRLYAISKRQLDALKRMDLELVEVLTAEREELTTRICRMINEGTIDLSNDLFRDKAHLFTDRILEVDEQIKETLLDELYNRTIELSRIKLQDVES
jgi:wobble nucleotide-excising tRNase